MKYATDEAMRTGMTLQKGYIDNGDSTNARALDDAKRELKASIDQNSHDIESVSKKVDLIIGAAQYYVAEYLKGSPDNTEIRHLGNKDILKNFGFVLLDTSDNKNITTKPKRLKDNNLLRFEDGTFAQTVGITTEQYNQCMANDIYSEESGTYTLEYRAGQFNAAVQWEKDKALIKAGGEAQKLYTRVPGSVGDTSSSYKLVTHVLRPWETTETKYTIGIANLVDMYLLDNQVGDSGAYWKGIFLEPVSWDGIDVTKHKLPPTAIGPCPVTTIQENGLIKTRNFFYLYKGMTNCQSDGGLLPNHDFYEADRTYPLVEASILDFLNYARYNNAADEAHINNLPYPFAEGGYFATNVFITALELAAGTRYIHQASLFGSGISSNDGCTAANFFTSGGCRFKKVGADEWSYRNFSSSGDIQYDSSGRSDSISRLLTNDYPKEQCMESQMAASMATELGINPTTDPDNPNYFEFYGNRYYYMNVPGFDGLQEGRMNTRVYKYVQKTVSAYSNKAPQDFDMEVVYRMSLFNGANLCGDVHAYNMGGLEMLVKPNSEGEYNYDVEIYTQPDQTKWHSDVALGPVDDNYTFPFENTYEKIASFDQSNFNYTESYALIREGYTPYKTNNVSLISQGECYHGGMRQLIGEIKERLLFCFRGISSSYDCSPRSLIAVDPILQAIRDIDRSGTLQALIEL